MSEFKIGDKVRVVQAHSGSTLTGKVLTVTGERPDAQVWVDDQEVELFFVHHHENIAASPWKFELVTPELKVGDKVRIIGIGNNSPRAVADIEGSSHFDVFTSHMQQYVGKVDVIKSVSEWGRGFLLTHEHIYNWMPQWLELYVEPVLTTQQELDASRIEVVTLKARIFVLEQALGKAKENLSVV